MILSVDGKFSNLRNRTIRLNPFQLCFAFLAFVSILFSFLAASLPCQPPFSKLTISRAGFFASCDRPDGGGGVGGGGGALPC